MFLVGSFVFTVHRALSPCHLASSSPRHFRSHFRCLGRSSLVLVACRWVIRHHLLLLRGHGGKAPFVVSATYFSSFFRDYRALSHRAPSSVVCGCSHPRRSSAFPCALRGEESPLLRRAGAAWCRVRGGPRERRAARVPCDARGNSARGLRVLEEPAARPALGAASLSRFGPSSPLAACATPPNAYCGGCGNKTKKCFRLKSSKNKELKPRNAKQGHCFVWHVSCQTKRTAAFPNTGGQIRD